MAGKGTGAFVVGPSSHEEACADGAASCQIPPVVRWGIRQPAGSGGRGRRCKSKCALKVQPEARRGKKGKLRPMHAEKRPRSAPAPFVGAAARSEGGAPASGCCRSPRTPAGRSRAPWRGAHRKAGRWSIRRGAAASDEA